MNLKDWVKQIILPLVEKPEDADLFLAASDLKAVEVSDEMAQKFNQKYLTRERAFTDEELVKKFNREARGMAFGSVDQKLKKILPFLSESDRAAIDAETDTIKKLELLERAIPNIKGGTDEEKIKQVSEAARKKERELHENNEKLTLEINNLKSSFETKLKDAKLDYNLRTKVMGFELAPEFSEDKRKNFLADSTISRLKQDYVLEFDESNPSTIHLRKNIDGAVKDVYEGNKIVTLDDVLKKEYEPFIKKSNGNDKTHTQQQQQNQVPLNDQPLPAGATLRDRILANAGA